MQTKCCCCSRNIHPFPLRVGSQRHRPGKARAKGSFLIPKQSICSGPWPPSLLGKWLHEVGPRSLYPRPLDSSFLCPQLTPKQLFPNSSPLRLTLNSLILQGHKCFPSRMPLPSSLRKLLETLCPPELQDISPPRDQNLQVPVFCFIEIDLPWGILTLDLYAAVG